MRYLKNINEFVLLASVSCGVAFLARLYPPLFWATLIIRIALLMFMFYLLYLEGQREIAIIISGACLLGWALGYGDYFFVVWHYDANAIVTWTLIGGALLTTAFFVWSSHRHGQTR